MAAFGPNVIQTWTGRYIEPLNPSGDDVVVEDVAHHLANLCRFTGAVRVHYCPTPDQRVLTDDLRWVPAGDLKVGDGLLGFDEHANERGTAGNRQRRYRRARVLAATAVKRRIVRLEMIDGSTVRASVEHPWLVSSGRAGNQKWMSAGQIAKSIRDGQPRYINRFVDTWKTETSRDAGWLAGMYDGEGHISGVHGSGMRMGVAQKQGPVLEEILRIHQAHAFVTSVSLNGGTQVMTASPRGGIREMLRLMGTLRPMRLLDKFVRGLQSGVFAKQLCNYQLPLQIVRAFDEGEEWVAGLETSTRTYFCEGFPAHNSVAEHAVRVSRRVEEILAAEGLGKDDVRLGALCALHHDDSEAYLNDMAKPVKRQIQQYQDAELRFEIVLRVRFGLVEVWDRFHDVVKQADEELLATERRDLMKNAHLWAQKREPLPGVIMPWTSEAAKARYLGRHAQLGGAYGKPATVAEAEPLPPAPEALPGPCEGCGCYPLEACDCACHTLEAAQS